MTAEFRLLGDIEAWVDGEVIDLGHARQRCVLSVLLIEANHTVSTDQLLDRVWGERAPSRARETLYGYLHRLRRALLAARGVQITRHSGGYLLAIDPMAMDLHRFRDLSTRARASENDGAGLSLWAEAIGLWRGPAFSGLDTPWINSVRSTLDQERLTAELDYTDLRLQLGQPTDLLAELSSRAAQHPWDERVAEQLMLALYRSGRQADALAAFRTTSKLLADELGLNPGPQLRQLHEQILRSDPELFVRPLATTRADSTDANSTDTDTQGDPDQQRLDRAVRDLATAVTGQWQAEVQARSLQRPEPVHLRWSSTGRPVAAAASAVLGKAHETARPELLILRGDLADVVQAFRRLPARQLVVLGEPGAGKTVLAILLTLGLLGDRAADEPIPVLLPVSSWDPRHEHLHTWLADKLVQEYPGLANTATYGPDAASRLVAHGRVLPVLDGLDEIPPGLHAAAIDALDRAIAGDRPVVVTCRGTEYEKAVHHGGAILARAAVVEIEPVEPDDVITFLTARHRVGDTRWQAVAQHLRRHQQGPLAQALSTPLMADLARAAYTPPTTDPTELCDTALFPDQTAIQQHLLDAFLPAVYTQAPAAPTPGIGQTLSRRYFPEQAHRWLAFLARHLQHLQTRDLAWWRMVHAIGPGTRALVLGLPPALLFAVAGLLAGGPVVGLVYGLSTAVAGCIANGLGTRPGPRRVEVRLRGTGRQFVGRFAIGLAISLVFGVAWSLPIGVVLLLVVVFGFGIGLHVWLVTPPDANQVSSPAMELKQDRIATLSFAMSLALSLGVFFAVALAVSQKSSTAGSVGEAFYLGRALPAGLVTALFGWFGFRRPGSLGYGLAGAAVAGQVIPHHTTLLTALVAGALFGLAVGLTVVPSRSWGAFVLIRTWLALQGRTPLRLMPFLDDARCRGVLRQAGSAYQFRHARLQDRLATQHEPEPVLADA